MEWSRSGPPELTAEGLLGASLDPAWADAAAGAPVALVVVPGGAALASPELQQVRGWLAAQPIPLVGYGLPEASLLSPELDVLLRSASDLEQVIGQITARPAASAVLVQVLRAAGAVGILEALALESLAYAALQGGKEFAAWLAAQDQSGRRGVPKPQPEDVVRLERTGAELEIRLDSPGNRNALSVRMRDQLTNAFRLVAMDDAIERVHVRATGPCFSAGGDLTEFGVTRDTSAAHQVRMLRMPARYLAAHAGRYVFHVHGACVGAGIELAAFAGRITATSDAFFQLPEVAMGLIPGAGGCVSIPRRIGRQRTAWLAFTNRRLDAAEALAWGLVDAIDDG